VPKDLNQFKYSENGVSRTLNSQETALAKMQGSPVISEKYENVIYITLVIQFGLVALEVFKTGSSIPISTNSPSTT
jgi:hypothetical protein